MAAKMKFFGIISDMKGAVRVVLQVMRKTVLFVLAFIAGPALFAGEVLTGDAAKAKFPAALQGMGLHDAKYMQLMTGVEYFYGRFDNLAKNSHDPNGFKNDMHLIRVDYAHAPVRLKFWDSTTPTKTKRTTSAAASKCKALFGINGTFTNSSNTPQGFTKFQGTVIPNGNGCNAGLAMKDDKTFKYAQGWNATNAKDWDDVITSEAYGLHNGSIVYEGHFFSPANYPFSGATADGVIWIGVVDGRRSPISVGVSYWEVAEIQKALGCVEGMCHDGGGSTTMVISKELMTASDICGTQKESKSDSSYYTMNYLSDGSERAVINQLLFVEYDEPSPSVEPGKPAGPFGNAEAAANAAQKATLEPSAEVAAKLSTDAARERYMGMFGFAVTQDGDEWYVEAVLTEKSRSNLVESAQEATRQIAVGDLVALAAEGSAEVSVSDCIPGFYYTLYDGAAVGDLSADADERNRNVLCGADGGVVFPEVKKPSAAAGFFSIGAKESPGVARGERQE